MKNNSTLLAKIDKFFSVKDIAIAGVSRNNKKFGYKVFEHLRSNGFNVYPIHPEASEIDGIACYKSPADIPQTVKNLFIVTPKHSTDIVLETALNRGFDMIWIQQKSETEKSLKMAMNKETEIVTGKCIFMYVNPKGPHAFHRFFVKLFGKL